MFSCSSKIHKCFYISIYRDNNAHLFRTEGQHTPNNSRVSAKNNVPLRWLITVYATTLWQLQWKFQNNSRVQHKNDIQTENSHKNQNYTTTERKFFSFLKFDFRSDSHFFFARLRFGKKKNTKKNWLSLRKSNFKKQLFSHPTIDLNFDEMSDSQHGSLFLDKKN